jgi:D-serine dehydratase
MADAGILRLIHANEAGGVFGAHRLASFVATRPNAEIYVFADSVASILALDAAWRDNAKLPPLRALVEVGAGRAGARTLGEAKAVAEAIVATHGRLTLAGVATYEGSVARATLDETLQTIAALMTLAAKALVEARRLAGPSAKLIVTAGGSAYFDLVVGALKPAVERDGEAKLVLRSGSIFFHDHGIYDRSLAALDERRGFQLGGKVLAARSAFRPALRVWAEVLSRPERDLAICGLGMRDVSFDHDLPKPLVIHRGGRALPSAPSGRVIKLNDQHAFLTVAADDEIAVGDIVEFGVSHPCTTLDRYSLIFGVDEEGFVCNAFPTCFG